MKYLDFGGNPSTWKAAILIKESALVQTELEKHYINYLNSKNVYTNKILAMSLDYVNDKAPMKVVNQCIESMLGILKKLNLSTLYVADSVYFKKLAKVRKVDPYIGEILPCAIEGYEHIKVIYGVNYRALLHDPANYDKLASTIVTLKNHLGGELYKTKSIIEHAEYPKSTFEINRFLEKCKTYDKLYADTETFSLSVAHAGLGTVGFSWSKSEGGVFPVDAIEMDSEGDVHLSKKTNFAVRKLLKKFFEEYSGQIFWHNASFDLKILTYELFMSNWIDYEGMHYGIKTLTKNFEDTKLISYLALNACGSKSSRYSLKSLAQEYSGKYAIDEVTDITKCPMPKLLKYNLIDCLNTAYVAEKYYQRMVDDDQLDVYTNMLKPSVRVLIATEIVGLPINLERVEEVDLELGALLTQAEITIRTNPHIYSFEKAYREALATDYNNTHKVKRKTADDFKSYRVLLSSVSQVSDLLFVHLKLPIIETTETGAPSCTSDVLENLKNFTKDKDILSLLNNLITIKDIAIIKNTFIRAFYKNSVLKEDGNHYLLGNFNIGGTVSGRLSSSKPNLQNLPSGSVYGKLVKSCFQSNSEWLFTGADYASLEDRIDALLTKDPNKLKVYTDGYDGHSLRAYYYFKNKLPDIEETVESINSISNCYKEIRQDSKGPTFALTYDGTWRTLTKNCGFSVEVSKQIVSNYKEMYKVSIAYKEARIIEASECGYTTVAFGLRVRTPLTKEYGHNNQKVYESVAEGRTAKNAMGQSYGMLNNRAMFKIYKSVLDLNLGSEILPSCAIHDANYWLVRKNVDNLTTLNSLVSKEMSWCGLKEISHDSVGLSGELDIFYPSWATPTTLPNFASKEDILEIVKK